MSLDCWTIAEGYQSTLRDRGLPRHSSLSPVHLVERREAVRPPLIFRSPNFRLSFDFGSEDSKTTAAFILDENIKTSEVRTIE